MGRSAPLFQQQIPVPVHEIRSAVYMTVQGMQQHEQSSVERQLHLPGWGLTTEPADEEMVEAGILTGVEDRKARIGCRIA